MYNFLNNKLTKIKILFKNVFYYKILYCKKGHNFILCKKYSDYELSWVCFKYKHRFASKRFL